MTKMDTWLPKLWKKWLLTKSATERPCFIDTITEVCDPLFNHFNSTHCCLFYGSFKLPRCVCSSSSGALVSVSPPSSMTSELVSHVRMWSRLIPFCCPISSCWLDGVMLEGTLLTWILQTVTMSLSAKSTHFLEVQLSLYSLTWHVMHCCIH